MAKIWRPVKDGNYGLHGLVGIDADGAEIDMCAIDPHGIAWPIEETLPSSLRLCELGESDAPAPVPLPDEVEAAIRAIIDGTNTEDMGTHTLDYWLELSGVVMDWLDAQGKDAP